ncbi:uncharacterized protein EV154DRAFT_570109 [Mucor mucedo]|uniref:uncharacterized protein n=1 Tax=Mucor mucedo TaxID=29922 RepID=UPI00221FC973|nr:uncharacterized protein EV154DRAFT_570109 [Mucor mucedo]KAI7873403.1 hypothetical protein EV154DRAFT_570109 [Mucor mucedo]
MDYPSRQVVFLRYPCYICGASYSTGPATLNHISTAHGQSLPRRRPGIKRPFNMNYSYQPDRKMGFDLSHHGCSSCWFHSGDYGELQEHVKKEHTTDKGNFIEVESGDEEEEEEIQEIHKAKTVRFEDSNKSMKDEPYDMTVATTIARQIVDLGAMLTKILKM